MYTSRADRDAAIEEGAGRAYLVLAEDLTAACERLQRAAQEAPDWAWSARLTTARGAELPAARVPWLRTREVWLHLVDLDVGAGFDAIPAELLEPLLEEVVGELGGRAGVPALTVHASLPGARERSWRLGGGDLPAGSLAGGFGPDVRGGGPALLAWLTGRRPGHGLTPGPPALPALPPWA
jgi:maleylpyruvate isomerase